MLHPDESKQKQVWLFVPTRRCFNLIEGPTDFIHVIGSVSRNPTGFLDG